MVRPVLAGVNLALLLNAAPVRAEDPEPPRKSSEAKDGNYVVKLSKKEVTASDKQGRLLWRFDMRVVADTPGQVAISGQRVIAAQQGLLAVLDLSSGKALWMMKGVDPKAKMRVENDRVTLNDGKRKTVIDLATGKTLEIKR